MSDSAFLEKFVLATDRRAVLKDLVPDSADFYFYTALYEQTLAMEAAEAADAKTTAAGIETVDKLISKGSYALNSERENLLRMRQRFLKYPTASESDQKSIMDSLRSDLSIYFNHTKPVARHDAPRSNYPTVLDPKIVELSKVLSSQFSSGSSSSLSNFTSLAKDWIAKQEMDNYVLYAFLNQLQRPSVPELPKLIAKNMKDRNDSFGTHSIHRNLTLEQYRELEKLVPSLSSNLEFQTLVLRKLQPADPIDQLDAKAKADFYTESWDYALKLPALFNSLKSSLMHHCLVYDQEQERFDFDKFLKWLDLPRHNYPFSNRFSGPEYKTITVHWCSSVQAGVLNPRYDEAQLSRDYLCEYFRGAGVRVIDKFAKYFDKDYLLNLLAETKILLNGARSKDQKAGATPDAETTEYFNRLGSGTVANLKARVDLEFLPNNKKEWAIADDVKLSVFVKNIPTLIVKLFKINARSFYRQNMREVDASINLDGLTPWEERAYKYDAEADEFQRVRRVLEFPKLKGLRGVFVVELLGNGKFSRAVIRKGQLTFLEHQSPNGHVFRLLNEASQPVAGTIWLGGHTYSTADSKSGLIVAPYTGAGSVKYNEPIILTSEDGESSSLVRFNHQIESYTFGAAMYIDRESLLSKSQSQLLIRPALYLNNQPIALTPQLLKKATLRVNTTNDEGVNSSQVLNDFKLVTDGKETVHPFTVPDNLRQISFQLDVEVRVSSTGSTRSLSSSVSFPLNGIDDSDRIDDLHLRQTVADGYSVYLLGKSGEARPHSRVTISLTHTYITQQIHTELQTDENGRIVLGPLPFISSINATAEHGGANARWSLQPDYNMPRGLIHATENEAIRIPYNGLATKVSAEHFSLFDDRNGVPHTDLTLKHVEVSVAERSVLVRNLKRGTYSLVFKEFENSMVQLVVARGDIVMSTYVMEPYRFVELRSRDIASLQITDIKDGGDSKDGAIEVRLSQYGPEARVHVFSSHFYPEYSIVQQIQAGLGGGGRPLVYPINRTASTYYGSKNLGDEQQYILDRKLAKKYTGNMLPRPSLLLNERTRQLTTFDADPTLRGRDDFAADRKMDMAYPSVGAAAGAFGYGGGGRGGGGPGGYNGDGDAGGRPGRNLEFLSDPSVQVLNVAVDQKSGVARIPRSAIGKYHTHLVVVAADGHSATVVRRATIKASGPAAVVVDQKADSKSSSTKLVLDPAYTDSRLIPGLSPARHLTEQYLISVLATGESKKVDDIRTATVETYETLGDVWTLYNTLAKGYGGTSAGLLTQFQFVMEWPDLRDEKKAEKYSEYSCHELNFFLYHKDRAFFDAVVMPFLKDKLAKTFMDRWFLRLDLSEYTAPYEFSRLNALEKILLAQSLLKAGGGRTGVVSQFVQDKAALIAKDPQYFIELFKTALMSRALDDKSKAGSVPKKSRDADRAEKAQMEAEQNEERHSMKEKKKKKAAPSKKNMAFASSLSRRTSGGDSDDEGEGGGEKEMAVSMDDCPAPECEAEEEASEAKFSRSSSLRSSKASSAVLGGLRADVANDEWAGAVNGTPARRLFAAPPTTKEVEERNYFEVPSDSTDAASRLITNNQFWSDYALFVSKQAEEKKSGPFLSQYIAYAAGNFTEIMCALAVIDLPYKAGKHEIQSGRIEFSFKAATPAMMFHREVKETAAVPSSISVTQTYFDPSDPTEEVDGETVDKYISQEFLPARVYGCRTVLTNVSSTHQKVAVLKQIPSGSMPVTKYGRNGQCRAFSTRTEFVDVQPFSTYVLEFYFYFPGVGKYWHYPIHVSKTGKDGTKVIGHGTPLEMNVVGRPTLPPDVTSWKYISVNGTEEQVLNYLRTQNCHRIDLGEIAWRYRESQQFYRLASAVLRDRMVYHPTLASYALHYNDAVGAREFLAHHASRMSYRVGPYFRSSLYTVDAFRYQHNTYQHFEYTPLINARAHQLKSSGGRSGPAGLKAAEIQNVQFRAQYARFLNYLLYRSSGRSTSPAAMQLASTYYLLLQDRNDEAAQFFATIDMKVANAKSADSKLVEAELQMQYDYLSAYLDFFAPAGPTVALSIAKKYANYPVAKKRALFKEIADQIFEASPNAKVDLEVGKEGESRDREMANLAATEPALELVVENQSIEVTYANISQATVNFYVMDLELLFSTNPFVLNTAASAAGDAKPADSNKSSLFVSPNFSQELKLSKGATSVRVEMPAQFATSNVFVEVVSGGLTRMQPFYSNSVSVQVIENYGQVKVTERKTQRPLPKAYVKVYAKEKTGGTNFYKDGYTDSRGRFDYASLSTSKLPNVERFAVLIMTDANGAVVREAAPPSS